MTLTPQQRALLAARLMQPPPRRLAEPDFRRAAVLVPLLQGPGGLELLFTVRSSELTNHAGQVAFPGGGLDPGESVWQAARREAREEVGLEIPEDALLGTLSDLLSPARYVATPVVALLAWPQPLTLNRAEVAEAFTVPLAELQALVPRAEERELRGVRRVIHYYPWGERLIWGFTGNIVKELLDRLAGVPLEPHANATEGADAVEVGVGATERRSDRDSHFDPNPDPSPDPDPRHDPSPGPRHDPSHDPSPDPSHDEVLP